MLDPAARSRPRCPTKSIEAVAPDAMFRHSDDLRTCGTITLSPPLWAWVGCPAHRVAGPVRLIAKSRDLTVDAPIGRRRGQRRSDTATGGRPGVVMVSWWRNVVNLILLVIILMILFGGGGFYYGGPYVGGGLGTVLLIVLIVLLVRG